MKIYIVRHGETLWNNVLYRSIHEDNFRNTSNITDRDDDKINLVGLEQAHNLAGKLKDVDIDLIISSPMIRAIQTADIISEGRNVPIILDEDISVRKYGEFKGVIDNNGFLSDFWKYQVNRKYNYAENIRDFFDRIYHFLDELPRKYGDKNILLVTHGSVTIAVHCYFKGIPDDDNLLPFNLENGEVACYEYKK